MPGETDYTRGMRALREAQARPCSWPKCTAPRAKGDHYCGTHRETTEQTRRDYAAAVTAQEGKR